MKFSLKTVVAFCALSLLLVVTAPATATFNLRITEIYSGQENPDPTEDWFEITNYGDMAWVEADHGSLFYDDESADPGTADLMSGVPTILPGQSVIFVDGGGAGLAEWQTVWSNAAGVEVGSFEGAGLGGGGDTVVLFTGDSNFPDPGISNPVVLDSESYPSLDAMPPGLIDGASWDVVLQAFSIPGQNGAFVSAGAAPGGNPAIGSPGFVVPEPTSIALVLLGLLPVAFYRNR